MKLPWRQRAKPIEPRPMVSTRAMELETAKEILAEVFHARPGDPEAAGGERAGGARGRAVAGDVLPGGVDVGRRFGARG